MKPVLVPGNRIELLESGTEYFPALLRAIAAATTQIHFESYIFEDDATGQQVAAALARAAQRGVAVQLVVDGFGARDFVGGLGRQLSQQGVEVLTYRPEVAALRLRRHRLRRMHRKLAVIDARVAFVGGINVIDDLDAQTARPLPPRYDYAVRIEGPLLADIHGAARRLWTLLRWARLRRRAPERSPLRPSAEVCGSVTAAFVIRDNLGHRRDIEEAYLAAIAAANERIVIANAYFLPGRRFRRALCEAAQRGVEVVVLLQGRVEYPLLHYATQALHAALLGCGVRIFEYRRSFLHAKVAVIDDLWATVGSSNIDPFSLLLAREANVVVDDGDFARRLGASLQHAMDHGAVEVRAEDVRRRSLVVRAVIWLAYGAVRALIGFTRYGGRDYRD